MFYFRICFISIFIYLFIYILYGFKFKLTFSSLFQPWVSTTKVKGRRFWFQPVQSSWTLEFPTPTLQPPEPAWSQLTMVRP